jgi:hypothetical protein
MIDCFEHGDVHGTASDGSPKTPGPPTTDEPLEVL